MNSEVSIIGGGIVGTLIALKLSDSGYNITIYESNKKLGGVLKDIENNSGLFLNGCKTLNADTQHINNLLNIDSLNLKVFSHNYGSFTDMFGINSISNDYAGPVFENKIDKDFNLNKKLPNLYERFLSYPKEVSSSLIKWFEKYNLDAKKIHPESASNISVGRIYFRSEEKKIINLKKKSERADLIFGIPHNLLKKKLHNISLPEKGYNGFFSELKKILTNKGINVKNLTSVKPIWKNKKKLLLNCKGKIFEPKKIIWTGNPTYLIKEYNSKKLDSFTFKVKVFWGNLKNNYNNIRPFYINVYSRKTNIIRIFLYSLGNIPKISIETIDKDSKTSEIINFTRKILKRFNIDLQVDEKSFGSSYFTNYSIISNKDRKIIEDFNFLTKNTNLINGTWILHSIDEKLKSFIDAIKKSRL